jgi:hypothetical protein
MLFGAAMVAGAIYLLTPFAFTDVATRRDDSTLWFRAGLFAVGAALWLAGLRGVWSRRGDGYLGDFRFVDGQYLWDVNPSRVRVIPIHTVREASGIHRLTNGAYNHTDITLVAPEGKYFLQIANRGAADQVIMFLNACAHLRSNTETGLRLALHQCPELLAEVARKIIDNRLSEGVGNAKTANIPQPHGPASTGFLFRNAPILATLAGSLLIGMFVFPEVNERWSDEHLFAAVRSSSSEDAALPRRYLDEFSQGRHVAEVASLWDDRRFTNAENDPTFAGLEQYLVDFPEGRHTADALAELDDRRWKIAETTANDSHSPAALRDYLADARNNRHRIDAQQLIDGFYNEAIARIKSLSENQSGVDAQLSGGLLALLESLKTMARPVVTIGFSAQRDLEPAIELFRTLENEQYNAYLAENPALKDVENTSTHRTAILPLGDVFTDEQIGRRESFILDRLREAVHKVLNADMIAFERVPEGQTPTLLVEYHSYPAGGLYLYTRTETTTDYQGYSNSNTAVRGLLRGYLVDWKLRIQPPHQEEAFTFELSSKPGDSLYYRPNDSDPDWAVYAVIMYSAFHDFSGKLISGFGLEPPTPPVSFSFADATGSHDTSPTYVPSSTATPNSTEAWNSSPYGAYPYNSSAYGAIPGAIGGDVNAPSWTWSQNGSTTDNSWNGNSWNGGSTDATSPGLSQFNSPMLEKANAYAAEYAKELFDDANANSDASTPWRQMQRAIDAYNHGIPGLDGNPTGSTDANTAVESTSANTLPETLFRPELPAFSNTPSLFDSTTPTTPAWSEGLGGLGEK